MNLKDFYCRIWYIEDKEYIDYIFCGSYKVITSIGFELTADEKNLFEIELWSGYYDSKDVSIYENDIVFYDSATYKVVYESGMFCIKNNEHSLIMAEIDSKLLEVIGNIHENAKELEG